MKQILETFGEEETRDLGRRLGRAAVPGEVICLDGDLASGRRAAEGAAHRKKRSLSALSARLKSSEKYRIAR